MASLKIGQYVSIKNNMWGRYGKITAEVPPHSPADGKWFHVRWINPDTGKLFACPDDRCKGASLSCPICGCNRKEKGLLALSDCDIEAYREYGLISDESQDA